MNTFIATDLEGTLTAAEGWKSIRKHFDSINRRGVFRSFFISQLPRVYAHHLGWMDTQTVRNRWMADMARVYTGWTEAELAQAGDWMVETDLWPQRRAEVLDEIMRQHAAGATVLIVSGLYEPILRSVARRLGGEHIEAFGTHLEMKDGRATGRITGEVCGGENKAERVKARIGAGRLVAAYGDTSGDAPMLAASEQPVAVFPDGDLAGVARARGWRVLGAA